MAFNWDKLCKAQRDYPKPKFALDAAGKLLKKRPTDPYLLVCLHHYRGMVMILRAAVLIKTGPDYCRHGKPQLCSGLIIAQTRLFPCGQVFVNNSLQSLT